MSLTVLFKNRSLLFSFFALAPFITWAQQSRITVDVSQVMNPVPERLYGACIEDVNHEIYGGLYDQRLFGESFEEPAASASFQGWKALGGKWEEAENGVKVNAGPGYKLVNDLWLNGHNSVQVQLKFGQSSLNAGLLLNVNHECTGADNFWGYEISLDPDRQVLVLGKHVNNWMPLKEVKAGFAPQEWNTLKVETQGARFRVWLNNASLLDFTDSNDPLPPGKAALRTFNSAVWFRNMIIYQGKEKIIPVFHAAPAQAVSAAWDLLNTTHAGYFILDTANAFNGHQAQVMVHDGSKGRIGLSNLGLNRWGIAIRKGQTFAGSLYLKAADLTGPVTIALQSADGSKVYAVQRIDNITPAWEKYTFRLRANAADHKTRFACYIEQKGTLWIDQVTLMSTGEDQFKGLPLRADIAVKMQQEGLNFLRYGGTMVNAPGYRWKKMIGDRDQRRPYTGHWYPYSTNGFGIEDFLQFCEAAGFEAAFAINIEETPQDAADMVEYLKGDLSTHWGKVRALNGHPAPYKVRYFEIGNEEVLFNGDVAAEYDHYMERFNMLYTAMKAKDTTIKFINAVWWRPGSPNTERLFRELNGKADYWDLHTDADDPYAGKKVDSTLAEMQALFQKWDPATRMKCAIFEENGGKHDLARALGHATTLNAVRRHGTFVLTSCAANALQPFGQNDNGWDQGQVFFTPWQVWGMPPFYVQQMAAANHLPLRVYSSAGNDLDVTATCSKDGRLLALHIVNPSTVAQRTTLTVKGFSGRKADMKVVSLSGQLGDVNTPEHMGLISPKETRQSITGDEINYTFPAASYTILRFER